MQVWLYDGLEHRSMKHKTTAVQFLVNKLPWPEGVRCCYESECWGQVYSESCIPLARHWFEYQQSIDHKPQTIYDGDWIVSNESTVNVVSNEIFHQVKSITI